VGGRFGLGAAGAGDRAAFTPALTALAVETAFFTALAATFRGRAGRAAAFFFALRGVDLATAVRARPVAFLTVLLAVPDARVMAFRAPPDALRTPRAAALASDLAFLTAPEAFFRAAEAPFFAEAFPPRTVEEAFFLRDLAVFFTARPALPAGRAALVVAFRRVARAAVFLAITNPFAQP
jgi:hypothetical protein